MLFSPGSEVDFLPLEGVLDLVTLFSLTEHEKGQIIEEGREMDTHHLNQMIKVNITIISHIDVSTPWNDTMRRRLHFYAVPFQNPLLKFNHGETSDKYKVRDSLQTLQPVLLKIVKDMSNKERPRNSLGQGRQRRHGD